MIIFLYICSSFLNFLNPKHDVKKRISIISRSSDFFQDWWAKVTHGAKNGGSFSEMMGPRHIKLTTVDIWVVYFTYTLTQTLVSINVY